MNFEILEDENLFQRIYIDINPKLFHYNLIGTGFIYSQTNRWWLIHNTKQETMFYHDFSNVFDLIIDDKNIDKEIKTKIMFYVNELFRLPSVSLL